MYTRAEHHSGFLRPSFAKAQHRPKWQFHSRCSGAPEKGGGGVPEINEFEDLEKVPSRYPRCSRRLSPDPPRPALPEFLPKVLETRSRSSWPPWSRPRGGAFT